MSLHPHSLSARLKRLIQDPRRLRALPGMLAYRVKMLTTDRLTDMRMSVSTSHIFRQTDSSVAVHASPSQPVSFHEINRVLNALPRGMSAYFVDIGCGVGRACFFAAYYGQFPNIVGVDFDATLIDLARKNAAQFHNRNGVALDFQVADAREYCLPDNRCVVFLYNPFDAGVLRQFLEKNKSHFQKRNSLIVYVNDVHRDVMIEKGLVSIEGRHGTTSQWRWPS